MIFGSTTQADLYLSLVSLIMTAAIHTKLRCWQLIQVNLKSCRNYYFIIYIIRTLSGTPSLSGTTTLTVSVTNSNDKDPFFTPSTQRAEVREDAAVGTVIHNLVAIDPDVESNDVLQYSATEPITAVDKDGKEV